MCDLLAERHKGNLKKVLSKYAKSLTMCALCSAKTNLLVCNMFQLTGFNKKREKDRKDGNQ